MVCPSVISAQIWADMHLLWLRANFSRWGSTLLLHHSQSQSWQRCRLSGDRPRHCYEMVLLHSFHFHVFKLLKLYYCFLSILSLALLDLILSGGFILFLKDIFHLIGIWSCGHYYKVQGQTHGKHMPDTCLPHVVHMYYCALLCNAVCTVFSIVLLIPFHLTCTASSFHLPIMHSTY